MKKQEVNDGMIRARAPDALIDRYAEAAKRRGKTPAEMIRAHMRLIVLAEERRNAL